MEFIISAASDMGIVRATNQDSVLVKLLNTLRGRMVFAVLCDGMGGLAKGELASATLVRAFNEWIGCGLLQMLEKGFVDYRINKQWEDIIVSQSQKLWDYGRQNQIRLGTTVTAMLLTDEHYYVINVGDTRAYEIFDSVQQITDDQTVVADKVRKRQLTELKAKQDIRRNMLLQCVGASEIVQPDIFFGEIKRNASYLLCSDGFRNEITTEEMWENFQARELRTREIMDNRVKHLVELNKSRNERDNISVVLIRTF